MSHILTLEVPGRTDEIPVEKWELTTTNSEPYMLMVFINGEPLNMLNAEQCLALSHAFRSAQQEMDKRELGDTAGQS